MTRLRVEVSDDGEKWLKVECGRRFKFDFQTEASKIVSAEFDTPVVAR